MQGTNRKKTAEDVLRWLYRERRLNATELAGRLRALDALASGKLPSLACLTGRQATAANPLPAWAAHAFIL